MRDILAGKIQNLTLIRRIVSKKFIESRDTRRIISQFYKDVLDKIKIEISLNKI